LLYTRVEKQHEVRTRCGSWQLAVKALNTPK